MPLDSYLLARLLCTVVHALYRCHPTGVPATPVCPPPCAPTYTILSPPLQLQSEAKMSLLHGDHLEMKGLDPCHPTALPFFCPRPDASAIVSNFTTHPTLSRHDQPYVPSASHPVSQLNKPSAKQTLPSSTLSLPAAQISSDSFF